MFDDDLAPQKKAPALKDLVDMGIVELEDYISELKSEIARSEKEIEKKKIIRDRAASVFK
jgi:uncharacterized small protein (DUF1192 family)